jgi:hypothetical protein
MLLLLPKHHRSEMRKGKSSMKLMLSLVLIGAITLLPSVGIAANKIKVVATFTVIADMVANVAGDRVDLATIVGHDLWRCFVQGGRGSGDVHRNDPARCFHHEGRDAAQLTAGNVASQPRKAGQGLSLP